MLIIAATVSVQARAADPSVSPSKEASFLKANDAAMKKMMDAMTIEPSGDVDKDFVAIMVPHHQGAVDMAVAVLRYGHNERIKRLAEEIIITQQQEIVAMRMAVGECSFPAPHGPGERNAAAYTKHGSTAPQH